MLDKLPIYSHNSLLYRVIISHHCPTPLGSLWWIFGAMCLGPRCTSTAPHRWIKAKMSHATQMSHALQMSHASRICYRWMIHRQRPPTRLMSCLDLGRVRHAHVWAGEAESHRRHRYHHRRRSCRQTGGACANPAVPDVARRERGSRFDSRLPGYGGTG